MSFPKLPSIIETPNHFWYGPVDLAFAMQGDTKVERLSNDCVKVTKTFIAKNYRYSNDDSFYKFQSKE